MSMSEVRFLAVASCILGTPEVPATETAELIPAVQGLLKGVINPPEVEGGKSSLSFFLGSKTMVYSVPKSKAKVSLPHEITKRSITSLFEKLETSVLAVHEELEPGLSDSLILSKVKDSQLIRWSEEAVPNISSFLLETLELEKAEVPEAIKIVLNGMSSIISQLEKSGSVADPDRTAKNKIMTSLEYAKFIAEGGYVLAVREAKIQLEAQINNLMEILAKLDTVTEESVKALAAEKFTANGCDDKGYLKLKGKAEEKPAPKTEEVKA